ncbi:hypothetical protein AQJ27_47875 [Streptomyces olivochromogenes]|uniref:DNA-binding protein n=1 Tax=Streptomyces olivochromogenes TaxID=1963 RepID=A0A250VUD5_STROL|nr:hypothetical protein AQJ27_47875 [Streptomyces olivochromogenes]GAX57868.1 DNA-binding protein [Streptomyces olivochromogenes]
MPGLRRDEPAQLAGVGLSYYTRLEQGLSLNASPEVLDAPARALGLDEVERAHPHDLARASRRTGTRRRPARVELRVPRHRDQRNGRIRHIQLRGRTKTSRLLTTTP